jgi:hypothetical protein
MAAFKGETEALAMRPVSSWCLSHNDLEVQFPPLDELYLSTN